MIFIISLILFASLIANGIFVWYTKKLIQNLYYGVNNIDELQKLLNEYVDLLESLEKMENYYGDPAITSAINNTKIIIQVCKTYKNSIIESYDDKKQNNEEAEEDREKKETTKQKAKATISPI